MTPDQQDIDHAVRRTAGIAALRQIRRLVDEDIALERWRSRWALRIGVLFAVVGGLLAIYLVGRSLS